MKKILVTGNKGQVGFELMKTLAPLGKVIGVDIKECDLAQSAMIDALLDRVKPDIIVNPAAYTSVDKAESEPTVAHAINAQAPKTLARQASRRNIPIIHFSTDYIFDGTKEEPYVEDDPANPKSVYGKTKWLGEEAVRSNAAKHVILRTSWVFGAHGVNFLKTMLKLSKERDKMSIVSDQIGAPTSARMLAEVTAEIVKQLLQEFSYRKYGTYHLVADGETCWYGYAKYVVEQANALGMETKLDPKNIKSIKTKDFPLPAARPANSRLDTTKVKETFGITLPTWQSEVDLVLNELIKT